ESGGQSGGAHGQNARRTRSSRGHADPARPPDRNSSGTGVVCPQTLTVCWVLCFGPSALGSLLWAIFSGPSSPGHVLWAMFSGPSSLKAVTGDREADHGACSRRHARASACVSRATHWSHRTRQSEVLLITG